MNEAETGSADHTAWKPRLRASVRIGEVLYEGPRPVVFVTDLQTGLYLRVGVREAFLFRLLDGNHTREDASELHEARYGAALDEAQWNTLLTTLAQRCLLEPADPATVQALALRLTDNRRAGATLLHRRFPVPVLAGTVPVVARRTAWILHPLVVGIGTATSLAICAAGIVGFSRLVEESAATPWRAPLVLAVVLITAVVIVLHEYGHGVACSVYGGRPQEMGLLWRFPILAPYCKVDDIMVLPRRHRVMISFAGIYINLLALIPYAALWYLAPQGSFARALGAGLLLMGIFAALVNLIPIFFLDGHRMAEHATGTHKLAAASVTAVGDVIARRREALCRYPGRILAACLGYAAVSAVCVLVLGTLIVRSWWLTLESLWGPLAASAFLVAEAVLIGLLAIGYQRWRQRRGIGATGGVGRA